MELLFKLLIALLALVIVVKWWKQIMWCGAVLFGFYMIFCLRNVPVFQLMLLLTLGTCVWYLRDDIRHWSLTSPKSSSCFAIGDYCEKFLTKPSRFYFDSHELKYALMDSAFKCLVVGVIFVCAQSITDLLLIGLILGAACYLLGLLIAISWTLAVRPLLVVVLCTGIGGLLFNWPKPLPLYVSKASKAAYWNLGVKSGGGTMERKGKGKERQD